MLGHYNSIISFSYPARTTGQSPHDILGHYNSIISFPFPAGTTGKSPHDTLLLLTRHIIQLGLGCEVQKKRECLLIFHVESNNMFLGRRRGDGTHRIGSRLRLDGTNNVAVSTAMSFAVAAMCYPVPTIDAI